MSGWMIKSGSDGDGSERDFGSCKLMFKTPQAIETRLITIVKGDEFPKDGPMALKHLTEKKWKFELQWQNFDYKKHLLEYLRPTTAGKRVWTIMEVINKAALDKAFLEMAAPGLKDFTFRFRITEKMSSETPWTVCNDFINGWDMKTESRSFGDCNIEIETPSENFKSENGVHTLKVREIGWAGDSKSGQAILEEQPISLSNLSVDFWNDEVLPRHNFSFETHTLEYYAPEDLPIPKKFTWVPVCSTKTTHKDLIEAFWEMGKPGVANYCFKFRIKEKPRKDNFFIGKPGDPNAQRSFGSCHIVIYKKAADSKSSEQVDRFKARDLAQTDPVSQPEPLSRDIAVRVQNLSYELWEKRIQGKSGFDYDRHQLSYAELDGTTYNAKWRPILAEAWQKDNNGTPWRTAINQMIAIGVHNHLFRFLIQEKSVTPDTKPAGDPVIEPVESAEDASNTIPPDETISGDLLKWKVLILHPKFSNPDGSLFCTETFSIRELATPEYMAMGAYLVPDRAMQYRDLSWDTWTQHTLKRVHQFYKNDHNLEYRERTSSDFLPLDPSSETAWRKVIMDTVRLNGDDRLICFRISDKPETVAPVATPNSTSGRPNAPRGPDRGGTSGSGSGSKSSSASTSQSSSSKPGNSSNSGGANKSSGTGKNPISGAQKPPSSSGQSSGNGSGAKPKRRRSSSDKEDSKSKDANENKRPKVDRGTDPGAAPGVNPNADPNYKQDAEDNDAEDSNDIDANNEFLNLANECDQMNGDKWLECCRFYRIEPSEAEKFGATIDLGGILKRPLRMYQAYAIYWMLKTERHLGGGFLSDEQGLGKTSEAIGLCIVQRILENAIAQVEADRAADGPRAENHLPDSSKTQKDMKDAVCPSEARGDPQFPIACPCAMNSPSRFLCDGFHRRKGPVLVLAPAGLLGVWKAEFDAVYRTGSLPLDMTIMVRHTNYPGTAAEKALFKQVDIGDQSAFIIVTSSESYENHVLDWEPWRTSKKQYSRVIRDEFHQKKGVGTNNIRYMRDLSGWPFMWALSGTPFEKSPEDLEGYLSILRRQKRGGEDYAHWWKYFASDDDDQWEMIKHAQQTEFKVIISNWNKLMKNGPEDELKVLMDFLSHFGGVLRTFMIRRTTETKWFGSPITEIPDNDRSDVPIDLDPRYTDDMKWLRGGLEWEMRQRAKNRNEDGKPSLDQWKASYMLRLAATFPAIARFHRKAIATQHLPKNSDAWRFTGTELKKYGWYDEETDSPYSAHYNQLAESSNKLKWLFEKHLEKRVGGDIQTPILPPGKDHAQDGERIIILSSFPAIAYITYLWLKNTKKQKGVQLIQANTPLRQKIINEFQGVADEDGNIVSLDDAPRILISTPALIGSGYTLTRAFRLVLLEPAYMARDEEQAYSRIIRIGQQNDKTFTFRLFGKNSALEKGIIKVQKQRLDVNERSFKEAGDGNDFGDSKPQNYDEGVDWSGKATKRKKKNTGLKYPHTDNGYDYYYVGRSPDGSLEKVYKPDVWA